MEIGVYHPYLKERGGAEKVIAEYAKRSNHNITIYTMFWDRQKTFQDFKNLEVKVISKESRPKGFFSKGLRFGIGSALTKIDTGNLDALIVSETGLGCLITISNHKIPVYGYIHTPLRAALPEFKEEYLKERGKIGKILLETMIKGYNLLEKKAWSHFDGVAANSKITKQRILNKGLIEEDKIDVINPGAEVDKEISTSSENYYLYPSRFRRYKRQDLAIEAFKEADLDDFKLILAGSSQEDEYLNELKKKLPKNAEIKTDLNNEEWEQLYSDSYAVLFLAEREDWGIVPIEAGSFGKPVIAVNEGGPKHSVKNGETGFLTEPEKGEIAERMKELAENSELAKQMGEKGKEHVKKFSWDNFAENLDKNVEKIV